MTMTTLPLRDASSLPQFSPAAAFSRVVAVFSAVIEIYAEALQQANDAEKRYPFASNE
jgi:hypothetical protein